MNHDDILAGDSYDTLLHQECNKAEVREAEVRDAFLKFPGMLELRQIPDRFWCEKFGVEPISNWDARKGLWTPHPSSVSSFHFSEDGMWLGSVCYANHTKGFSHRYVDKFDLNRAQIQPPSQNKKKYLQMAEKAKDKNLTVCIVIAYGDIRPHGDGHAFMYKPMKIDTVHGDRIFVSVA